MRKLTCFLLLLVSFYVGKSHAQKTIQIGYDCLENKDFGSAERAFRKGISKYPQQAYFGLAKLYFESKDVGNLDSALTNVERSLRLLGTYEDLTHGNTKDGKVKENNSDLSLFVYRLLSDYKEQVLWKYLTQLKASSADWLNVEKIMPYVQSDQTLESYKRLRDSLFLVAHSKKTTYTYWSLLRRSPSDYWRSYAEDELQRLTYQEWVPTALEEDITSFLRFNAKSKYVEFAEEELFKEYSQTKDTTRIKSFIGKYPTNQNIDRAWKLYFQLACWSSGGSETAVRAFLGQNPSYPFKEKALEDLGFMERRLLPTISNEGLFGFMDEQGQKIIDNQFESVGEFLEGFSTVVMNDQYGVIDKKGVFRIPCRYNYLSDFQNNAFLAQGDTFFTLLNSNGDMLLPQKYTELSWIFMDKLLFSQGENFGVMDMQGATVIDTIYDELIAINDFQALVSLNGKVGVINSVGDYLIPPEFDQIEYANGLFLVTKAQLKGIWSQNGEPLLPVEYNDIGDLRDNFIYVAKGGKFSHFNPKSKKMGKEKYPVFTGSNRIARMVQGQFVYIQNNAYFSTDTLMNSIKLTAVKSFGNPGVLLPYVRKTDGTWCLMNRKGIALLEGVKFEFVRQLTDSLVILSIQGKLGVFSANASWLIPPDYDDIIWDDDRTFIVMYNGKKGVFNANGHCLIACENEQIIKYSVHHWGLINNQQYRCYMVDSNKFVTPKS